MTLVAAPAARDVKAFIPSQDFAVSLGFYEAMGWTCNWRGDGVAELELGGARFLLQKYYTREWAENAMLYIDVDDAAAWHAHALAVIEGPVRFPACAPRSPRLRVARRARDLRLGPVRRAAALRAAGGVARSPVSACPSP